VLQKIRRPQVPAERLMPTRCFAAAPRQAQCASGRIFVIGGHNAHAPRWGEVRCLFGLYAQPRTVQGKFTIILEGCEKRYFSP
jgi:hypothetical protein